MPIFHSWAEVWDVIFQIAALIVALFAKTAFDRLREKMVSNALNPKLLKNISNSMDSARQNYSESLILRRENFRYFERVCETILGLNRRHRVSREIALVIRWYKIRMFIGEHSRNPGRNVLRVWHDFDRVVESWKTRFETHDAVRRLEGRYAP